MDLTPKIKKRKINMKPRFLVLITAMAVLALFKLPATAESSDVDQLIDTLVQKGVITAETASAIRAETAMKKQAEKEKQKEFLPTTGRQIKISGYTQVRYQFHTNRTDTDTDNVSSFDIRRARPDVRGAITERFEYRLQTEFAGATAKLLDATAAYTFDPALKITIGQFKIPFSMENLASSTLIDAIDRSQVVEALVSRSKDVIGNQNGRDIGVQASGALFEIGNIKLVEYAAGVFNGAGTNKLDANANKDYAARLVVHPVQGLDIGGSYYGGYATLGTPPAGRRRDRAGAELSYTLDPLTVKGEFIYGKDSVTEKTGWYAQAGVFAIPKVLQFLVKYDSYDPNIDKKDNETDLATAGVNLFITKWTYIQAMYQLKYADPDDIRDHAALAQFTIKF
jgi:phosphate-selective porin OprO/OprP